jgi:hypothetical protein
VPGYLDDGPTTADDNIGELYYRQSSRCRDWRPDRARPCRTGTAGPRHRRVIARSGWAFGAWALQMVELGDRIHWEHANRDSMVQCHWAGLRHHVGRRSAVISSRLSTIFLDVAFHVNCRTRWVPA